MKNLLSSFSAFSSFLVLCALLYSCSAPTRIDESIVYLSKEVLQPKVIDVAKALKKESKIHKLEDLDIEEGYIQLSASGNLASEQLSAKIYREEGKMFLITVLSATNIVHSQESISGLEGPIPAYSLQIKAFEYVSGDWSDVTETIIPKELPNFLSEYYNFDMQSGENTLPITAHFRKDLIVLQSQELKVDKIISLLWKNNRMLVHEAVKTLKMKNVHPALAGLEPQDEKIGLLLGVTTKDGYKTYWLVFDQEQAELRAEFDYIINRQENDFYYFDRVKVNSMSFCNRQKCMQNKSVVVYSKNFEEFLHKRKVASSKVKLDVEKNDKCLASVNDNEIYFIGNNFLVLGVKNSSWGCTEESKSAYDSAYFTLRPLSKNFDARLASYTSENRLKNAEKQLLRKALAGSKSDDISLSDFGNYTSFYIKREKGTVALYAQTLRPTRNAFSYGAPSFRPCDTYLSIAPPILAKNPDFPLKYEVLQGYVKDLRDCFVAPTQNIVCVLDDRELRFLEPTGKNVLFTLPLYKEIRPQIVSADWVTGDEVDVWNNFIETKYNAGKTENLPMP
jgi:hypothetical protein